MASKTLKAEQEPPVIKMADLGARLAKRRAELGNPELRRNADKNRTASKHALLAEIEKLGGNW